MGLCKTTFEVNSKQLAQLVSGIYQDDIASAAILHSSKRLQPDNYK